MTEEAEINRSNLAREAETARSNRQFELIGIMNAQAAQTQAYASTVQASAAMRNAYTNRMNAQTNQFNATVNNTRNMNEAQRELEHTMETERHNRAMEQLSHKSNMTDAFRAVVSLLK